MNLSRRDCLAMFGLAALPARLQGQTDAEKLDGIRKQISGPIQIVPVARNVSMITGAGGNIGVLTGPEGKMVIDSGLSNTAPGVLAALKKIDAQPLKYLVNTHWHFDHTEGNEQIHAAGATIVAHAKTRERLSTPQFMDIVKIHFAPMPASAIPTRTMTDGLTFYHGGEEVTMQHLAPAHTDTDIYVHLKQADVIQTGDLFFNGTYPLIDYSTGGNINGYVDDTAKILAVAGDSTKIIPGHGPLAGKADLIAFHDMLATLRDRVSAAKKSGKSLEETVAMKPSADLDAKWGKGMMSGDAIVGIVYNTL